MYQQNFFITPFHEFEESLLQRLREQIGRANELDIANAEYLEKIISAFKLGEVEINWESLRVNQKPREVTRDVQGYYGEESVSVAIYTFEVDFTGDEKLFSLQPGNRRVWRFEAQLMDDKIIFEIEGSDKAVLDRIKENMAHDIPQLNSHVAPYNSRVIETAQRAFEVRSRQLQAQTDGVNAFGVPIKDE